MPSFVAAIGTEATAEGYVPEEFREIGFEAVLPDGPVLCREPASEYTDSCRRVRAADGGRRPVRAGRTWALNRFALAWKAFRSILSDPGFAGRVEQLYQPAPTGPDLRVLAVLQRDGRLVDFLMEDVDAYSDAQIGAAVRDIHRGCRKALREYLTIEPIRTESEGATVTIPPGFDPNDIRLSGNVNGQPPFRGTLRHAGWRVRSVQLPVLPGAVDRANASVLAPAEVDIP